MCILDHYSKIIMIIGYNNNLNPWVPFFSNPEQAPAEGSCVYDFSHAKKGTQTEMLRNIIFESRIVNINKLIRIFIALTCPIVISN